jgi:oxidase EvaA
VTRIPLSELRGWHRDPETGDLRHDSGGFFTIEGLAVRHVEAPDEPWHQPIINQNEVGILGILVKRIDGVPHCLMQAKMEPGNHNGIQLSPTVQATRSNYTRVHRGRSVPYLEHFLDTGDHVVADVLQSEQGGWFFRKRNRNMVVETSADVEALPGFHWLTLGQLHRLLAVDDLINMDSRTVMSCLPVADAATVTESIDQHADSRSALLRSMSGAFGSAHTMTEILSWITDSRARGGVLATPVPLRGLPGWQDSDEEIRHESGRHFSVIGVDVRADAREVSGWTQPMIRQHGIGLIAFLVTRIAGVLHVLVRLCPEPGLRDTVELAPTVQDPEVPCGRPVDPNGIPFLDLARDAPAERVLFDTVLSEEGGRFYDSRSHYRIVEVEPSDVGAEPAEFRWLTVEQLGFLLRHSGYVNVQARTLIACLHSLVSGTGGR